MMCFKVCPISVFTSMCYLRHLRLSYSQTSSSFFIWSIYGSGNRILKRCGSTDPEVWERATVRKKKFSLKQKLLDLWRWINTSTFLHLLPSVANNPLVLCEFAELDTISHSPFCLSKSRQLPIETDATQVAAEFWVLKLVLTERFKELSPV